MLITNCVVSTSGQVETRRKKATLVALEISEQCGQVLFYSTSTMKIELNENDRNEVFNGIRIRVSGTRPFICGRVTSVSSSSPSLCGVMEYIK